MSNSIPRYADLPDGRNGTRCGWHVFGRDDQVGRLRLITPAQTAAAASLVISGECLPLMAPHDLIDPPLYAREPVQHRIFPMAGYGAYDDAYNDFFPQAGSHWDALSHYGAEPGVFYNGATENDIRAGRRNGIEHWSARGVAGRGVLLDYTTIAPPGYRPWDPVAITADDLRRMCDRAGVTLRQGDIVVLRTGFLGAHVARPRSERLRQANVASLTYAGLENSHDVAGFLWDAGVSAVVSDNPGIEVRSTAVDRAGPSWGPLHHVLIGELGFALGELWWLDDLSATCAAAGRSEFLLTSAPLHIRGGVGSPANALAML